jgi:two-component system CheB/CheR fusion protein
LKALPVDTGMGFVLVQHLDPKHESRLTELLSRTTAMPVVTVTDGLPVKPDHVYVIPPNADLTIDDGALALTPRARVDHYQPIDHFLRSLAADLESHAIGVVLSGNGTDGTAGLKAIKAEGGITFAQDEASAKYPSMPRSASAAADFVLPPEGIARELTRISRHSCVNRGSSFAPDAAASGEVLRALRVATGVDFTGYKPPSIRRRIARRMLLLRIDELGAYVRHLRETPGEAHALCDDLLIQVTGFFRDPQGFEALKRRVFPSLMKERSADEPIRIWVPGCATGEEAYSLVISLLEFLGDHDSNIPVQMFATDLSARAVALARAGTFPESIASEVSADRLRRFFVKTDGRYHISKTIRDACVFARQDLARDPPFSRLDLISCCNVLIYLSRTLQERIIPVFHYALKPTGFLKLGAAEGIGQFADLFEVLDRRQKVYARKAGPAVHRGFGLTATDRIATSAEGGSPARRRNEPSPGQLDVTKEADRIVLARYAPAGVVVNAAMEIVQIRGRTGPYLEASPGAASLNLFKMAREGLVSALRQALHTASTSDEPVRAEHLRVRTNGETQEVSLEVVPLGPRDRKGHSHYLILFQDDAPPAAAEALRPSPLRGSAPPRRREAHLVKELAAAREQLQAFVEEHEAVNEELRAATEELQSSNEELQSTNEEMETAKEELQATNEELTTVNDELNSRNLELGQISNDLGNLLASVQVPIIMVGANLRVRRLTPATERLLNVAPSDVGRPIGDLRLSVDVPGLESLFGEVMETLSYVERDVETRDGHWYSVRVRPYRTSENKIDGAVISFIDIDVLKRGLDLAEAARDQAEAIVESVREPLVLVGGDLRVVTANRAFYATFRVTPAETEHRSLFDLGNRQWDLPRLRGQLAEIVARETVLEDFEVEHDFEAIGPRTMVLNARGVRLAGGRSAMILLGIKDVTEQRRLEAERGLLEQERARRAEAEVATRAKDQFLAILSHELRTPLTSMLGWIRVLRTRKRMDPAATARALEVIERNTVLQSRLIEDLLDVSRIVGGTLRLDARPIMVAPAVEAAMAALKPSADAKGVRLESRGDDAAGPVAGDPTRLQQIVTNLVSNAIKFTPSGGRVEVGLARRNAEVEIRVRDTGKGIAAEELARIFTRFGDSHPTSHPGGGLGLGLTIVRHLVELHGGAIRAESAGPGQGATFIVTLPITDQRPAGQEPRRIGPTPPSDRFAALPGLRVLVVDDETDTRELLRTVLEECGAKVTVAASVEAALAALEGATPDVIVSDIQMPGRDGYDLIREVRALGSRLAAVPALALTAHARMQDREHAMSAGYQLHLSKPIEPADLVFSVATLASRAERPSAD